MQVWIQEAVERGDAEEGNTGHVYRLHHLHVGGVVRGVNPQTSPRQHVIRDK